MFATHPAPQDRLAALGGPLAWAGSAAAIERRQPRYRDGMPR
jgi:hypothetical protein